MTPEVPRTTVNVSELLLIMFAQCDKVLEMKNALLWLLVSETSASGGLVFWFLSVTVMKTMTKTILGRKRLSYLTLPGQSLLLKKVREGIQAKSQGCA